MAHRFAELGAGIAISGRRPEPLEAVVAELAAKGTKAAFAPCDVREPQQVDQALASITGALGLPDILVNNAAGNFLCASEDLAPKGFDIVVRIVLHGTFHCTRAIGRAWIDAKRGGSILSITTTYAETGSGFVLPSACAKAGWTPEQVHSSARGHAEDACWSDDERAVIRLADELHATSSVGDAVWQAASSHFAPEQLIELVMLAGLYHAVSFMVNALCVQHEAAAPRFPPVA